MSISLVIYLEISEEVLLGGDRLDNMSSRGIVFSEGQSFNDLYNERLPLYNKYSHLSICCENNNIEEICKKIIEYVI